MTLFEPGGHVYLFSRSATHPTRHRVAKVHKNGRIVVEGLMGQWTPQAHNPSIANGAGANPHGRQAYVTPATEEVEARVAEITANRQRWSTFCVITMRLQEYDRDVRNKRRPGPTVQFLDAMMAALDAEDKVNGKPAP